MLRQNFLFILLLCFFTILFFPFFILAQTQTQTQTIPPIVSNTATPSTQSAFSVTSHQSTLSSQLISTSSANLNPTSPTQIQSTSTPDQPIQIIDQSIQVTDNQSSLRLTPLELVVIDKDLDTKKIISPQQTEAISIDEDSSRVFTFDQIFPSTGLAYRPVQEGLQTELAFFQLYKYDFISIAFLIEAKDFELSEQNILELQSSDPTGETHGLTFSLIPQEENNTYHLIINFDQDWLKNQNRMPPVITSFLIKTSDNLSETIMEISDEAESNSTSNTSEEKNQPEEKSLKVTEVNSNNNPDKFYIPAEDIKGAEVVEFEKEFDLLNIKYSKTAIIDDEIIKKSPAKKSLTIKEEKETENENITKLKEILNKDTETTGDFLTYVIITNEENSDVHAITRSEKGLQKIIVKKDSLTSLLYESEKLKPELEDWQYKASSTPIFQFKKTVIARSENDVAIPSETNPNQSDWHDYKLKEITDIKVEEKEDFSLITQNFILEDNTKGQNILKLGFDGENYFSKWTFKLDDNQNINRLLWKTELNEKTEISQPELKTINTQRKIFKNGINIDWSDFKNEAELQTLSDQIIFTQIPIIFYPLGIKGALEIDPTVSLSTPGSTVQIDVSDHYRAIMDTGDTDNFIRIHDRAYTDSTVFAQDITESSTTSTTVYSTKESISADSFIGGDKYFVYVTAGFGHSSSSGRVDYEIRYNTSAQYTGIIEPQGNATAGSVYSISWFDVYDQPATPTDIDIRFKANTAGTAYAYHAQILTINLSDLAVTDWEYGSDVGSTQHTTTMTQQANITLSDADGSKDWLVFAMEEVVIDSGSVQFQGEIYDGSTSYMGYSREGESSLELLSYTLLRPFDDVTQNTVFSIRVRDDASGINDHAKSRVFALNLDAFESHKTHYADISIAISDTAWTELGNLDSGGNYTPTTTGDQLVFASAIWEAGSGYSVNDQLQIGGTTAPIGWDWAQSSATGHGNYNVDDEILQNVMTKISIPTSGQSITYDIIEVQASSQTADEIAMVVLSTKLAGGIGQGYNATHEFKGPCILETNTYCLRDDDSRTTTILETNDTKAKIRVEGKFNNEASTDYLDDESGTPVDLTVKVDYTFTVDGIFIENMTDFQSVGITLDTDSGHNGYEWLGIWADLNDETFDDTGNIIYGNGTTEATTTTDGAEFEDLNKYVVLPGTGSDTYQDAFIGIQKYGWYDDTGGTDEWHWDEANSGTQDLITTQEQDHLTSGKHYAKWFFLMLAEDNVDTQAERESYINDYRNPDTLVYTTGSEWDDAPASPGVNFDAIDDDIDCGIDSSLDLGTNMTIEAWIYPTGYGEGGYGTIVARGAGDGTGYQFYTRNASQSLAIWDAGNEVSTTDSIELNAWQHVAVVINGGNLSKFYVNGNDVTLATNFDLATSGSNTFYIGSFDGATDTFDGIIDEVRIWSEARTQEEIQQNMFKQLIGSESNLNGYWRLNENVGTTAYDETINNNDGVLTSGPTWQTGFVADHYNESEGAYTINTSTNQIEIDIDGGTYTRHNPNLKIRQYFLNTKPSTVTLEGVGLTEATDYNLDYKPFSDADFYDDSVSSYTQLAIGGDTADGSEYFFDEDNDYTLAFDTDDYLYLGSDAMFSGINIDLGITGVAGATAPDLSWEYWDGDSWANLENISGFTDATGDLTQDGAVYWTANPTNWREYSVNGSTDLYYIRAHLESGSYATSPVENFIKTDILNFQYLGNIGGDNQTFFIGEIINNAPNAPQIPFCNNTTAQTGQTTPVTGLTDHTPAFSAIFDDDDTSDTSSYYEIDVGDDSDWADTPELSDGIKTSMTSCDENDRSVDIGYSGLTLSDGATYYWRIRFWDNSDAVGAWSADQQFTLNTNPLVSSVSLNDGNNIDHLQESASVGVSWSAAITDDQGYEEISNATGKVYRSEVSGAQNCSNDNNNCYEDASCDLSSCAGVGCTATCIIDMEFHTEPTNAGTTYADQYWLAWVQATDIYNETGSTMSPADTTDVNSLLGLEIGSTIFYGELLVGDDTGSTNPTILITNTGNVAIDNEISGDNLCTDYPTCSGYSIEVGNQEYSTTGFTYGTGSTLSSSPITVQINLAKPTTSPSDSTDNIYWGIGIPQTKETGSYSGGNIITAVTDS